MLFRSAAAWIPFSSLGRFYVNRVLSLATLLLAIWLGSRILDFMVARFRLALRTHNATFSRSVLPLMSRIAKGILFVLAVTFTLANWGFDMTTVLAGVGIGGIAIALAAQKTVENLFGGIVIITDAPVSVGDFCKFGDRVGTVEDIGLRSTRVRTLDRTLVTIPNGEFSSMTLENFSRRDKVWFHHTLNLKKDTSRKILRTRASTHHGRSGANPARPSRHRTRLHAGPISGRRGDVDGRRGLRYIQTADYEDYLRIQQELLLPIIEAVERTTTATPAPMAGVGRR